MGDGDGSHGIPWYPPPPNPRQNPLAVWNASVDDFGAVADEVEVYNRVFYGGVDPGMRATIWPFLLGVFDFKSLAVEREAKLALRTEGTETGLRCTRTWAPLMWGDLSR